MRKLTLSGILVLGLFIQLIAQAPQSFKYQAVMRDISGNVMSNQIATVKISILAETETGAVVYSEVHNCTSNQFGTITLDIGKGIVDVTGNFSDLKWGSGDFFLKLEIDTTGGTDFQFMGTTQLLSVPYALHSRTTERFTELTNEQRDTMTNVAEGTLYYNTTSKALNYFNGTNWLELTGTCQPSPTNAYAGLDQTGVCATTILAGNTPTIGTGNWQIVSGSGGSIAEPGNPASEFTGLEGNSYVLSWTITNSCTFTQDEVTITIVDPAVIADAGTDQIGVPSPTTLAGNAPVNGTGEWTIISGIGGMIDDPASPTSIFSGLANNSYTLRWTLTTACSTSSDEIQITFTTSAFNCGTVLTDYRDGKTYNTVQIGSQCWMAQNLNIGTLVDGSATMLNNGIIEKYCNSNLESNCDVYGGLYQWTEMMQYSVTPGTQGICTPGWHVPSDDEWKILEGTVDTQFGVGDPVWDLTGDRGLDAGGKLKITGTVYWVYPNTGANNASGFTALGGGARNTDGSFPGFQIYGRFWTSTESSTLAYRHILNAGRADIARDAANKLFGLSVRCLKD